MIDSKFGNKIIVTEFDKESLNPDPPPLPTDHNEYLLCKWFDEVRYRLYKEGNIKSLKLDFPIRIANYKDKGEPLAHSGMTFYHKNEAGKWQATWVCIRVYEENTGSLLSIPTILITLLHEFAHCITPGESHTDRFYDNYAKILRVAEQLGIFTLPNRYKLNRHHLKRFDNMCSESLTLPSSCSPKYTLYSILAQSEHKLPDTKMNQTSPNITIPTDPLRVIIRGQTQKKFIQKTILLKERNINVLKAEIVRKMGSSKKNLTLRLFSDDNKEIVSDSDVQQIPPDSILNILI